MSLKRDLDKSVDMPFSKKSLEIFDIKSKTYFESIEDIELLRFLELGVKVKMVRCLRNLYL